MQQVFICVDVALCSRMWILLTTMEGYTIDDELCIESQGELLSSSQWVENIRAFILEVIICPFMKCCMS